jgi:hypothetical protein
MDLNELDIPIEVLAEEDKDEFLRFWIAGGDSFVTLRMGVFGENELSTWGMILADIGRHVVAAYKDKNTIDNKDAFAEIELGYRGRMAAISNDSTRSLNARN